MLKFWLHSYGANAYKRLNQEKIGIRVVIRGNIFFPSADNRGREDIEKTSSLVDGRFRVSDDIVTEEPNPLEAL
jgi:hypothetical protein